MPCLFTSSTDKIDVYWISEVILICPDGPQANPEVELHINGIVQPEKECNLTFVHRGEIYALKERSNEWSNRTDGKMTDWFCEKVMNTKQLAAIRGAKPIDSNKMLIGCRTRLPHVNAEVTDRKRPIPDIHVSCAEKDFLHKGNEMPKEPLFDSEIPIFSQFALKFERAVMQLFRVSFRTKFGLSTSLSQVGIEVEGPENAISSIRGDIADMTKENLDRRIELYRRIMTLYDNKRESQYDIILFSHPMIGINIENRINAALPITFPIESKGTPMKSAASLSRAAFFDMQSADFKVTVLAQATLPFGHSFQGFEISPEIAKDIEWLNRQCDREGI